MSWLLLKCLKQILPNSTCCYQFCKPLTTKYLLSNDKLTLSWKLLECFFIKRFNFGIQYVHAFMIECFSNHCYCHHFMCLNISYGPVVCWVNNILFINAEKIFMKLGSESWFWKDINKSKDYSITGKWISFHHRHSFLFT